MAKLSVTRLLDTARLLATESGKELQELIEYVNNTSSEVIRALRNGLSFTDNFSCSVSSVDLKQDTEQEINTGGRTPVGVFVTRVESTIYSMDRIAWFINSQSRLVVKIGYYPVPPSADATQKVTLVILY